MSIYELIQNNKINWSCLKNKCPHNCCAKMDKNTNNLLSLFNFNNNFIPLVDDDGLILNKKIEKKNIIKLDGGGKYIKCDENGSCPFLSNSGKCSIYKYRGASCKSYPFFVDKYLGLCIDLKCPGVGKGWTSINKITDMIDNLKKVYIMHFEMGFKKLKKN